MLNSDWAFDDPGGQFPTPLTDFAPPPPPLDRPAAAPAGNSGRAGPDRRRDHRHHGRCGAAAVNTVTIVVNGQNVAVPSFSLNNLSICYRYSARRSACNLSVEDLISSKALSGLNPFKPLATNSFSVARGDDVLLQPDPLVRQASRCRAEQRLHRRRPPVSSPAPASIRSENTRSIPTRYGHSFNRWPPDSRRFRPRMPCRRISPACRRA